MNQNEAMSYLKTDLEIIALWERNESGIPTSVRYAIERARNTMDAIFKGKEVRSSIRTVSCPNCGKAVWRLDVPKAYDFEPDKL